MVVLGGGRFLMSELPLGTVRSRHSLHSGLQRDFRPKSCHLSVTLSVGTPLCPYGLPTVGCQVSGHGGIAPIPNVLTVSFSTQGPSRVIPAPLLEPLTHVCQLLADKCAGKGPKGPKGFPPKSWNIDV